MTLRLSWILMLIVGLIPFSYGAAFVVAYTISAASGSQTALLALANFGQASNVYILKSDLATLFWGSAIIALSLKGLRRGVRWAWYLLMLIPLYYLGEAMIGWPMEAGLLVPLSLMSAVAAALPFQYFARSDIET